LRSLTRKNAEPASGTKPAPEPGQAADWLGSSSAETGVPVNKLNVIHQCTLRAIKANCIVGAGSHSVQGRAEGAGFIQPGKEKAERDLNASSTSKRV